MEHPVTWTFLLGIPTPWASVVTGVFVMAVLLLVASRARSAVTSEGAIIPDAGLTPRNVFELMVEGLGSLADQVIGHGSKLYVPILCSFFIFILASNMLGLVPGFGPPTSDFDITLALGVCSFLIFNWYGFKVQGMGYLKHFAGPMLALAPLIFTLEIIGVMVRPFSLGLRLFGNMFGDHLVLEIFTDLTKVGVPVIFYFLGTLVSCIQAFVFTLLTLIYIGLSVAHDEGH
ncbi:MAG: F0F1 ATP synthase subunit A [Candidatus Binatia bacterium]|nr:F0F1 ATP synthase subunit A [Candidatus Binatia bacterium]